MQINRHKTESGALRTLAVICLSIGATASIGAPDIASIKAAAAKITESDIQRSWVQFQWGLDDAKKGSNAAAIQNLEAGLKLNPSEIGVRSLLANLQEIEGRGAEALPHWEIVLALATNQDDKTRAQDAIARLTSRKASANQPAQARRGEDGSEVLCEVEQTPERELNWQRVFAAPKVRERWQHGSNAAASEELGMEALQYATARFKALSEAAMAKKVFYEKIIETGPPKCTLSVGRGNQTWDCVATSVIERHKGAPAYQPWSPFTKYPLYLLNKTELPKSPTSPENCSMRWPAGEAMTAANARPYVQSPARDLYWERVLALPKVKDPLQLFGYGDSEQAARSQLDERIEQAKQRLDADNQNKIHFARFVSRSESQCRHGHLDPATLWECKANYVKEIVKNEPYYRPGMLRYPMFTLTKDELNRLEPPWNPSAGTPAVATARTSTPSAGQSAQLPSQQPSAPGAAKQPPSGVGATSAAAPGTGVSNTIQRSVPVKIVGQDYQGGPVEKTVTAQLPDSSVSQKFCGVKLLLAGNSVTNWRIFNCDPKDGAFTGTYQDDSPSPGNVGDFIWGYGVTPEKPDPQVKSYSQWCGDLVSGDSKASLVILKFTRGNFAGQVQAGVVGVGDSGKALQGCGYGYQAK